LPPKTVFLAEWFNRSKENVNDEDDESEGWDAEIEGKVNSGEKGATIAVFVGA